MNEMPVNEMSDNPAAAPALQAPKLQAAGFSPREIARLMNKSWVAVKTSLHRARRAITPHLGNLAHGVAGATVSRKDGRS